MAATVPYRVKDLIHKYGWDFLPRLAALGVQFQAEAQILFVDSGATNAVDADDGYHGHSFENPLATIDFANGLCTASEGSVILVAPGHNEGLANAQIDFDVAGVTCIGLGNGTLRPRIDFDHANASIDIGANNVTLVNLGFLPSVTAVLIGVDVESAMTNFKMVDCEFMIGEDGAGVDEFVKAVVLNSGNHDCILENVKILAHASAAQATHGIHVAAASNRLALKNVVIDGPYATNGILETAAGLNHVMEDCSVDVTGTNLGFHASSTFAKRTRNLDGGAPEDTAANLIGRDDADNVIATTNVAANADGSVLEREEYIQTQVDKIDQVTLDTTPTAASLATFIATGGTALGTQLPASTSLYDTTKVVNTVGVTAAPVANTLADTLHKDGSFTYDNTTDSLEAIRDRIDILDAASQTQYRGSATVNAVATTIISAELAGYGDAFFVTDWVAVVIKDAGGAQAAPEGEIRDITAYVSATGTFTTAAFSAAVTTDDEVLIARRELFIVDGVTLKAAPASGSLARYIASGGTALGQALPDSMSLVDVVGNFTGPFNGAAQDDNVKASLDLAHTDLDAILADTDTISGATLPAAPVAGSLARFVASGGVALGQPLPSSTSLVDIVGNFTGPFNGAAQDDNVKASLDLAHTDLDSIIANQGTLVNTGGTATIGGIFGDAANSSFITRFGNIQTEVNKIGTLVNTGGTATLGGILGDVANSSVVTRFANIQTEVNKVGTLVNTGGTATLGGMFGDLANSSVVTRFGNIQTEVDKVGTITNTGGTASIGGVLGDVANDPVATRLTTLQSGVPKIVLKSTGSLASFGLTKNLFTVTGDVLCRVSASVDVAVTSTSGTTTLEAGVAGNTAALCVQDAVDGVAFVIGDSWSKTTAADNNAAEIADEWVLIGNGATIILTGSVNDITAGDIDFYCEYIPLSSGATVVAA